MQLPSQGDSAPSFTEWMKSKGYDPAYRTNYVREYQEEYPPKDVTEYKSTHWEEPNVLAHIRTNKRDVGGVRALHAEEFQSDWHQEGQKRGYGTSMPHDERHRLEMQKQRIEHLLVDTTNEEYHDRLSSELKKIEETLRNDSLNRGKVPDAPYKKTGTNSRLNAS